MLYNYHTHTVRCGHATGEDEEYVRAAIEFGVEEMGFSDHGPYRHEDGFQMRYRVQAERAEDYVSSLRALREKYQNEIKLHIGFEVEYCPKYFDKMFAFWKSVGAEYLILGEHFLGDEREKPLYSNNASDSDERLIHYVDCVIEGLSKGVFTYLAHPDMLNYTGDDAIYEKEMRRLLEACKKMNIPVEVNCLGIRDSRHYPNPKFWKIASDVGTPVVIGFDAHVPKAAGGTSAWESAVEFVKKFGLNYLEKPTLVHI